MTDPSLSAALILQVVQNIQAGDSPLTLAVPEIIEWGDIVHFRFSFDESEVYSDPEVIDLTAVLHAAGRLDALNERKVKGGYRLEALNADGEKVGSWSVLRCLSGEMEFAGKRFVVSEGDFFAVRLGLIQELAEFVDSLPACPLDLPPSPGDIKEEDYNAHVVESVENTLLLDKRTVRVVGATSPVEVCDVLSAGGRFVHVKRKLGSSQLSHLFSQGARSCELAVISPDFRRATLEKIREVATDAGIDPGTFRPFEEDAVEAATLMVDYAIVARWGGRLPSQALPFFSQLNLRSFVRDIELFGATVTLTPIEIDD